MAKRKHFTAEQIIPMLREAEVELARGRTVAQVCKKIGVTEQTYCRWRKGVWKPADGPGQATQDA